MDIHICFIKKKQRLIVESLLQITISKYSVSTEQRAVLFFACVTQKVFLSAVSQLRQMAPFSFFALPIGLQAIGQTLCLSLLNDRTSSPGYRLQSRKWQKNNLRAPDAVAGGPLTNSVLWRGCVFWNFPTSFARTSHILSAGKLQESG